MSKSTRHKSIPYRGACRNCGHHIHRPMPPTKEFSSNNDGIRVFCGECGKSNHITKADTEI